MYDIFCGRALTVEHPVLFLEPPMAPDALEASCPSADPLRIVPGESVRRWQAEFERELAMPFVPGESVAASHTHPQALRYTLFRRSRRQFQRV